MDTKMKTYSSIISEKEDLKKSTEEKTKKLDSMKDELFEIIKKQIYIKFKDICVNLAMNKNVVGLYIDSIFDSDDLLIISIKGKDLTVNMNCYPCKINIPINSSNDWYIDFNNLNYDMTGDCISKLTRFVNGAIEIINNATLENKKYSMKNCGICGSSMNSIVNVNHEENELYEIGCSICKTYIKISANSYFKAVQTYNYRNRSKEEIEKMDRWNVRNNRDRMFMEHLLIDES